MTDVLDALVKAGLVVLLLAVAFTLLVFVGAVLAEVRRRNREGWPR